MHRPGEHDLGRQAVFRQDVPGLLQPDKRMVGDPGGASGRQVRRQAVQKDIERAAAASA